MYKWIVPQLRLIVTTGKISGRMLFLVWLDRMHILNRLISVKNDRIMSALFTIGNPQNMETETIERLWTKVRPILCFMGDFTFF